jgi:hypothetical protein
LCRCIVHQMWVSDLSHDRRVGGGAKVEIDERHAKAIAECRLEMSQRMSFSYARCLLVC